MCTIMNLQSPHKTVDDSGFHIVQKNGQFEIVKLEPVDKKTKSKFNLSSCDNKKKILVNCHAEHSRSPVCHLGSKHRILSSKSPNKTPRIGNLEAKYVSPKYVSTKLNIFEETTHTTALLKTYSRVGKKDIKPTPICLEKSESPISIKTEPELDIVDEVPEPMEKNMKDHSIEGERLVPTGEHAFPGNRSIKILQRLMSPTASNTDECANAVTINAGREYMYSLSAIPNLSVLEELAKTDTKCNVCGMIFPKYQNQVKTLGKHFLGHKTSVINVVKEYNSDTHSKQSKLLETPGPKKSPVILNSLLKKAPKPIAIIPVPVVRRTQPDGKKKIGISRIETTNLPIILRKRKLIEIKPIPHDLLQRLRSCHSDQEGGKSHVVIGNTLIKPFKPVTNAVKTVDKEQPPASTFIPESKRSDDKDLSDGDDDDVEIVEQKPELIVIDDNDELEAKL